MKRPNIVVTRQMLDSLRAAMPDLAIRTTFIVGFPGETQQEFQALEEFLREQSEMKLAELLMMAYDAALVDAYQQAFLNYADKHRH
jgi:tRNA A37 methylthiotransferase MiaB